MGFLVTFFVFGIFATIFLCIVSEYKKAGIAACISLVFFVMMLATSENANTSKYEKNVKSGIEKLGNGQYDDMTEDEKEAAGDFLEWQKEQ